MEMVGHRHRRRLGSALALREWDVVQKSLQRLGVDREALEPVPFVSWPYVHRGAQALDLGRRHQAGMVVLVSRQRQAEAFDRVADETSRPIVIDRAEALTERRQIMAAEIGHQAREFVVAALLDQLGHCAPVAEMIEQPLAPSRAALEHQR